MGDPLAIPDDLADIWRPLSDAEVTRATNLIEKASDRLRQKCPFDIDARMALYTSSPEDITALNPSIVADVVVGIVKRAMVNPNGLFSETETNGPFSHSQTFVGRYDKTATDVRGTLQVTESDIDQLRPAVPAPAPFAFQVGIPDPQVLVPRGARIPVPPVGRPSVIVPDFDPGSGVE